MKKRRTPNENLKKQALEILHGICAELRQYQDHGFISENFRSHMSRKLGAVYTIMYNAGCESEKDYI